MKFQLIDRVLERSDDRLVALRAVSAGEEYLQDHFPGFPILPGVFMLEAMVQAARACEEQRAGGADAQPWVLGRVRALKYGAMVRPGASMRIEVTRGESDDSGGVDYKGVVYLIEPAPSDQPGPDQPQPEQAGPVQAASGRLTLRQARVTLG
ncbi:MAG: hypothetical protein RBS39_09360 [Phycisphaerales bacterium]|jgi:3-hydroxyacyl-[acyl-carrier-protein] dehydratase|nr:hypothetical protein [Phycisphaerales bacterium]